MSLGMLTLMGGLANGAFEGQRYRDQQDRQAKLDAIAQARADREQAAFDYEQQTNAAMANAAQPVQAVPVTPMGPENVDAAGNTVPVAPMVSVGGTQMSPEQAPAAIAAANAPLAVRQRQVAALQTVNPEAAIKLQAVASKEFDDGLNAAAAKGFNTLVDFTNASSAAPGKAKAVTSEDGKTVEIHQVFPDGTDKPTGLKFTNDAAGAAEAAMMLSKNTPPQAKVAHYQAVANEKRQEARDQATAADKAADNVRQDKRDAEIARHDKAMEGIYGDKNDIADKKVELKSMRERMPEQDKITYDAAIKRAEKLSETIDKAKADGLWDPVKNEGHKSLQTDLDAARMRAQVLERKYSGAAVGDGDPYGLRPKGSSADSNNPAVSKVSPAMQSARDDEGGAMMVRTEYGGNADKARADADRLEKEAANAKGDAKPIMMEQARMLRRGADVVQRGGTKRVEADVKPVAVQGPTTVTPMQSAPQEIPDPPMHFIGRNGVPDRTDAAYKAWEAQWGAAYAEKKRQEDAASAAAAAAARSAVDARRGVPGMRGNV